MTVTEMIESLETQLTALRAEGEFTARAFDVDSSQAWPNGFPLLRTQERGWSWGSCTSETCNHNSHDPYTEGPTIFVLCRPAGTDLFALPDGRLFRYIVTEPGYHFCPQKFIRFTDSLAGSARRVSA